LYPSLCLRSIKAVRTRCSAAASLLAGLMGAALLAVPVASAKVAPTYVEVDPVPPAQTAEAIEAIPLADLNGAELVMAVDQGPELERLPEDVFTAALQEVLAEMAAKGLTAEGLGEASDLVPAIERALQGRLSAAELQALTAEESLNTLLTAALGSLEPERVFQQTLELSEDPQGLLTRALSGVGPEMIESIAGGSLSGRGFTETGVGELERTYGITERAFAAALGTSADGLPETTAAFTAPLTNGRVLVLFNGPEGLSLAMLKGGAGVSRGVTGSGGLRRRVRQRSAGRPAAGHSRRYRSSHRHRHARRSGARPERREGRLGLSYR